MHDHCFSVKQEAAEVEAAVLSIDSLAWVHSTAILLSATLHPEEQDSEEMVRTCAGNPVLYLLCVVILPF
jgi:hypothetical protein